MKIIISVLLLNVAVLCQEHPHFGHQHQPTLQPALPRLEPVQVDRTGYSIVHGDAKSSVNVNFNPGDQEYLTDLATKQYLNINPNSAQPDQSSYNVGYSINIENNPKLRYRTPMPQNAHSYRQQKLLNAEVITGTHKDTVEKPQYEYASTSNAHPNFISAQPVTKVYSDVTNTHGYTWKSLSPGVEISGYHSLGQGQNEPQTHSGFDHAAALGRSQGFDISNVVEKGYNQDTPAYDINKALGEENSQTDTGVDLKFDQPSSFKFAPESDNSGSEYKPDFSQYKQADYNSYKLSGGNIEFDKSLFDGFYKNYNPSFYAPEITLPSPNIPKNIHLNLHTSASHQYPSYNYQPSSFKNPQLNMINQHYAFVQASEPSEGQSYLAPVDGDVKPVTEQQEDNQSQHSQPIAQKLVQNQMAQMAQQAAHSQQVAQSQQLAQSQQSQHQSQPITQNQMAQMAQQMAHNQQLTQSQHQSQQGQHQSQPIAQKLVQNQMAQMAQQVAQSQQLAQSQQQNHQSQHQNHQSQHQNQHTLSQHIIVQLPKESKIKEHKKYTPQVISMPVRQYTRPVVYDKNYRMKNLRPPPMLIIHQKY